MYLDFRALVIILAGIYNDHHNLPSIHPIIQCILVEMFSFCDALFDFGYIVRPGVILILHMKKHRILPAMKIYL